MKTKTRNITILSSLILLQFINLTIYSQKNANERTKWFVDSRYGMFIHWGIYSGAEGVWRGEKLRNDNDYAEWIFYRNRINKEDYLTILDRFQWNDIDPEEWVILAKKAGMKYITLTAKHHDGFALWDSKVGTYNLGAQTNHQRDIVKELAEACKKHGIRMGLYYSHWVDWEHEYGWDHTKELTGLSSEKYDIYWQEKVIPQVRELLTNYGEISMLWFDMWINHSETVVTKEQLLQLKGMIRELQPNCLVNSRLGLSIEEDPDIDYKTLGDNQFGSQKEDFPWQSPGTVSHSWGMHRLDTEWKSTSTILNSLVNNVSLNGNFMLNIGPRGNGEVQHEVRQRLLEVGEWLSVNGESIYGAEAFELRKNLHDWGRITSKKTAHGQKLYLHITTWPLNKQISLTGINTKPERVYLLSDKQKSTINFNFNKVLTTINLPEIAPDNYNSVVVVEYEQVPEIKTGLVARSVDGGYSMTPKNKIQKNGGADYTKKSVHGTVPNYSSIKEKTTMSWRIFIEEPKTLDFAISYSFQGETSKSAIAIKSAEKVLEYKIVPTGKTIGEPNQGWIIDDFRQFNLGKISFPAAGYYDINIEFVPGKKEEIKFQWLWAE